MKYFLPALSAATLFVACSAQALLSGTALAQPAGVREATGPATLLHSTTLPNVAKGGFDHFAVDLAGNRLFVTAEKNQTVEMFRLSDGAHLGSGGGYGFPHTSAYVPDQHQLFVADGDLASVKIADVPSLKVVGSIPLRPGPDEAAYDAQAGLFYVGNGGKADHSETSDISIIDVRQHKVIGAIPVQSSNIETIVVDAARNRLWANLRDHKTVAVIDLAQRKVIDLWQVPGLNMNTPMAYDSQTHRLFVVGRKPGRLFVLDADSGKLLSTNDCADIADGATYDAPSGRLFVSGAEGLSVFRRDDADHLTEIQRLDSHTGKVSAYVPSLHQLYIAHAATPTLPAALDIYSVAPASTTAN